MKITIEVKEEGRTVCEHFGRKRHVCDAEIGRLTATGSNKVEAAAALKAEVLAATLAPLPRARVLRDGRAAVAYLSGATPDGVLGYSIQLFFPDGRTSGVLGADLHGVTLRSSPRDIDNALRVALDKYADAVNDALEPRADMSASEGLDRAVDFSAKGLDARGGS